MIQTIPPGEAFSPVAFIPTLDDLRLAARLTPASDPWHQKIIDRIDELEKTLASRPVVSPAPDAPSVFDRPTTEAPPHLIPEDEPTRRRFAIDDGIVVEVSQLEIDGQQIAFITVEGKLNPGDENSFKQAVLTVDGGAIVSLKSPGGDLQAGMEIGRTIWTNQFTTVVEDGICASACALAWLAGRPRFATPNAQIGFHAPTRVDDPDRRPDSVGSALVGGYLTELGFTQSAIAYMTEKKPNDMQWLTGAARGLGIYVEEWQW